MSSEPKHRLSLEEYFGLEQSCPEKFEYFDGDVFGMGGASLAHEQIVSNVLVQLRNAVQGRNCRILPSNIRVKTPGAPPYRYPDIAALCEVPQIERMSGLEVLLNPALLVEVLSPATEAYDRGDKFTYYKSITSFAEYVLIAQHRPHVTHYAKQRDGSWTYEEINGMDGILSLGAMGCELRLHDIYEAVDFTSSVPPLERR